MLALHLATNTRVRIMVNPSARVPTELIDRAMEAHLSDGRSRTVSVRKPEIQPTAIYRTLRPSDPVEGAVVWARAYDSLGDLVAQTPCLRVRDGMLVVDPGFCLAGVTDWRPTLHDGMILWNVPDGSETVEKQVLVECEPWEATLWMAPGLDWVYDIGCDLRLRPHGPIQGRQDLLPLVEVCDAFVLVSEGNGVTKGFLLDS